MVARQNFMNETLQVISSPGGVIDIELNKKYCIREIEMGIFFFLFGGGGDYWGFEQNLDSNNKKNRIRL